jgi:hypothetical protein
VDDETKEADEAFWNQAYFKEEENDQEFSDVGEGTHLSKTQ